MTYAKIENGSVVYPPRNDGNRFNVDKDEKWLTDHGFTPMTAEELANAIQSVKNFYTVKEQTYQELWCDYKAYQQKYVDAEDFTLATLCASHGSAKGAAVQQWCLALWSRYYEVKDLLAAAETLEALRQVDISTAELTPPPYTIRELNEEAAAFLAKGE